MLPEVCAVLSQLDNHTPRTMIAPILILLLVLYLLMGSVLCVRGPLAWKIASETAILATYDVIPVWKVSVYRWALRAGVVVLWPAFLLNK